MASQLKAHDCFGAILRSSDGTFAFVSAETGKVYATLDKEGLHVQRGSGKRKKLNLIPLKALEVLLREVKKA